MQTKAPPGQQPIRTYQHQHTPQPIANRQVRWQDQRPEHRAEQRTQALMQQSRGSTSVTQAKAVIQRAGGYIPAQATNYNGLGNNQGSPGNDFSGTQRTNILAQNQAGAANVNAIYRDDRNANPLTDYGHVQAVDHIYPASLGGMNAYKNAQVIDAQTNSGGQRDVYPSVVRTPGYNGSRLYIGHAVAHDLPYGVGPTNFPVGTIMNIAGNGGGATINMLPHLPGGTADPGNRWSQVSLLRARGYGILTTGQNPL